MSTIRSYTKSFVGSLFILAVFLAMLPDSFAEDYETPHRFEAGDVISADMMNEIFTHFRNTTRSIQSSDLIGTWSYEQTTVSGGYPGGTVGESMSGVMSDQDNLIQTRWDTVAFSDDDGTYSWGTQKYHPFQRGSARNSPASGSYIVKDAIIVFQAQGDSNRNPFNIERVSATRYKIFFMNIAGGAFNSIVLDKQNLPPAIPTDLSATTSGLTVTLTWTDNSNDETGFEIMRRDSLEGEYNELTTTAADTTSYDDTVSEAGDYWYRVKATNNNGDSLGSNVVKVTVAE